MSYSLAVLHRLREQQAAEAQEPKRPSLLDQVPPDAPMDAGIVLGFWNGERFVSPEKWLATAPLESEAACASPIVPADAKCMSADCGGTGVWLVKDGERWLMHAGSRRESSRRRDFATPFLAHAQRTAETWYGPAADGWSAEKVTARAGKGMHDADPAR